MKKLILLTGLLVALSGLIRSVDAQTSIVGYGSTNAGEIHLIDLDSASLTYGESISSFIPHINNINLNILFQGLAIDPLGKTLYGSTSNGKLYRINIATGAVTDQGDMGINTGTLEPFTIQAMDFNYSGDELWVMDFHSTTPTIYKINNFDTTDPTNDPISAEPVQTLNPEFSGVSVVRAMSVYATNDVWAARDNFIYDFQLVDTDMSPDDVPLDPNFPNNVQHIGFLDDDLNRPQWLPGPKIKGMDRADDGMLYGLAESGGIYSIDQESGILTLIKDTDHVWLGLAATDAYADAAPTTSTIKIALDIKPKHCPNKLYVNKKRKKKRRLKAAILGAETFNVRNIEIYTIRLNGVEPKKYRYKDLTCPTVLNPCDCEALDADTFEDLVLYFKMKDIVDVLGDVHDGDEIPLTLIGRLTDGVTEIEGTDCVLIEVREDDNSSNDGRGHKKKRKKECKKKRHHGYGDNSGH